MTPMQFVFHSILIALSVIIVLPGLVIARFLDYYDGKFNCLFGETIRSLVTRSVGFWLVPLFPFYALTWQYVGLTNIVLKIVWLVFGFVLIEVHSACLQRESWIAAFEPELISLEARPLGGEPTRKADRRLQYMLLILVINAIPLLIIGVMIPIGWTFQCILGALFIIRYFEYGRLDFEACMHWNMHCKVLTMKDKPLLSQFWEAVMDYTVGPLSGYVPRVYNANHLLVHHSHNSDPMDIHSPTPFRRSSFLEFCFFAMKLSGSIMFASDLAFHKKCRGKRRIRLLANLVIYWSVVSILIVRGSVLGSLLLLFAIHHGIIMARFQYVWHGLIHPDNPTHSMNTTALWVANEKVWSDLLAEPSTSIDEQQENYDRVPRPGTDWAYFDNYHLIHHLQPNAHFTAYPKLLAENASKIVEGQCVVLTLDVMGTFPFDCWTLNIDRIVSGLLTDLPDDEKREFIRSRLEPTRQNRHPIGTICETQIAALTEKVLLKFLEILTDGL